MSPENQETERPRRWTEREIDPLFANDRVGLAVMEMQVVHYGHLALLSWMRSSCGHRILALGSSDLGGQPGHPFGFSQRKAMVEALFGPGAFICIPLNDIESTVPEDWWDYVRARIESVRQPRPTDYFCGSRHDAVWYEDAFARLRGPGVRQGPGMLWSDPETSRCLRILDREQGDLPSARQIRDLIELRDGDWRQFVPPMLWNYIDWHYPPAHRVALRGASEPDPALHPVGTLFKGDAPDSPVLALRDDRKWRPVRTRPDEKAEYARGRAAARTQGEAR